MRPLLFGLAAAAALTAGAFGYAGAGSIEGMLRDGLSVSDVPALLGPIDESGRTGWKCKPEISAAAKASDAADLPVLPRH